MAVSGDAVADLVLLTSFFYDCVETLSWRYHIGLISRA